jgi:hypothetical protein
MYNIGIDGGLKGGISVIKDNKIIDVIVMPIIKGTKGNIYDINKIIEFLEPYSLCKSFVVLEKAHSMPKQGVVSTFKIGECYGIMKGIIQTLKFPFEIVAARTWQKAIFQGQTVKDTKQSGILYCKNRFPSVDWRATERSRIDHDGKTDAACIAVYASRLWLDGWK